MIEYDDEVQAKKLDLAAKEMQQYYQNVFSSAEGRKVLGDILAMCHFGTAINSEA